MNEPPGSVDHKKTGYAGSIYVFFLRFPDEGGGNKRTC